MFQRRLLIVLIACLIATTAACGAAKSDPSTGNNRNNEESGRSGQKRETEQKQRQDANRSTVQPLHARSTTPNLSGGKEVTVRAPRPMSLSDLRRKYPSTFVLNGSPDVRKVALTFDDAPDAKFTPMVLDALKKEGVKATFFVIGNRAEAHPDMMRRIVNEGHVVGNHSYSHANLPKLSDKAFQNEIQKTDKIIRRYAGYTPSFVRPPYGNINEKQIQWLAGQHRLIVNWNIDSLDWKGLNADEVSTNIMANIKPGAIILQHAGGGAGEDLTGTVKALPKIIAKLRADQVSFVTVPDLLGIPRGGSATRAGNRSVSGPGGR